MARASATNVSRVHLLSHQSYRGKWHPTRSSPWRRLGPNALNEGYKGNSIRTSKYNIITFLPFFLYFMFSRVAYLYFLGQVSCIPERFPLLLQPPILHPTSRAGCITSLCTACATRPKTVAALQASSYYT